MSILVFGHLLPFLYNKCCRLTLSILCLRLGINTFTTLFTSSTLVHFSGKWYLETPLWVLAALVAPELHGFRLFSETELGCT